jgi:hypothetical protein
MGTFFTIGFGILIAFGLVCVLQMVGNDLGKGFMMVYGNTYGEKYKRNKIWIKF